MRKSHHVPTELQHLEIMPQTPVSEVMRRDVICVPEDMTEASLIGVLIENDLPGAPVVDAAGFLVGYVSLSDILRERYENADTEEVTLPVRDEVGGGFHVEVLPPCAADIMSTVAVEMLDTAHLDAAAVLMSARQLNHLPVVDKEGHVVGILHAYDVLRWLEEPQAPVIRDLH